MDVSHPKRRKDKDNPYTISISENGQYVSFKDGQGVFHNLKIDKSLYTLFNRFELEDKSYLNFFDRYIEHSELTESSLNERAISKAELMEDIAWLRICNERLYHAIAALPETQRRRLVLYYFYDLTYERIAELERCSVHSVFVAIKRAEYKIKKFSIIFKNRCKK
ncbi:MAG: sigma-70 region 4 domain-containing protein [Clostridiales bacterium]|nr:sigma-70 region 4 domain-containing protein [Clostridiales bacterium]